MMFDLVTGDRVVQARVSDVSEIEVHFVLGEELAREAPLPVTLLLAIFKFDRMEWAIEKATELGVTRMIPVVARRTEKHLAQAATARVERWRRIAREAAQQSRRSETVAIDNALPLKAALDDSAGSLRLLLSENERETTLRQAVENHFLTPAQDGRLTEVWLAVGCEGGWTAEEEQLFAERGWRPVTLGPRILRAETAAVAALAVVAACLEN